MLDYNEQLFIGLKNHKSSIRADSEHALHFPISLAMVIREYKKPSGQFKSMMYYESNELLSFTNRLGVAISQDKYDTLPEIIFTFLSLSTYWTPICKASKLTFTPDVTSKFYGICNSFIGKSWDDVLDPLIDALYELITAGYLVDAN